MADRKLSNLTELTLQSDTEFYVQRSGVEGKTDLEAIGDNIIVSLANITPTASLVKMTLAERTKLSNISSAALSGTAGTPSVTNKYVTDEDTRFNNVLTNDEKGAISGANSPSASNPFLTTTDLSASYIVIQGTVDDYKDLTPGYVESTDVAEDSISSGNGTVYCSALSGGLGGTSLNWSDVLPITVDSSFKRTEIDFNSLFNYDLGGSDENFANGKIIIDWENSRIHGYIMACRGKGDNWHLCWRFVGAIAGVTTITGVSQNGDDSYAADPAIQVNGTTKTINRLPMVSKYRNVGYTIHNFTF